MFAGTSPADTHRADIVENGKERSVYRWGNSGGSFGCNPLVSTWGSGRRSRSRGSRSTGPTSDLTQTFHDVAIDRFVHIREGDDELHELELEPLRLGG